MTGDAIRLFSQAGAGPQRFAACASDALQCTMDIRRTMEMVRGAGGGGLPVAKDVDWKDWKALVMELDTYFWSSHTSALVTAASRSYPVEEEEALSLAGPRSANPPTYLPRLSNVLCVFSSPCVSVDIDGWHQPLSALAWRTGISVRHKQLWLSLRGFVWAGSLAGCVFWSDGGSIGPTDAAIDGTFRTERLALTKWACTASMFIEQEIVGSSEARIDRGTRRRLARADVVAPSCHVVTLRREAEQDQTEHGDNGSVEWSHQWVVRGHWRRQFYPKRGGHAPVWIHPHVKGPADKPFVEPAPTVYRVTR